MKIRPRYFFTLGELPGTPLTRYALVAGDGNTVIAVQVSVPDTDLMHIERPTILRWLIAGPAEVAIKQFRINEVPAPGEQPRRTTWRRSGKRAAAQ